MRKNRKLNILTNRIFDLFFSILIFIFEIDFFPKFAILSPSTIANMMI
jgi:hypothetical protein